ncbi:hypothetical protein B2J88_24840 [Rhodococcus sp. SRB_17]|nr:hypothetical protein [Rhodococcus sp. SRB_17]
MMQSNTLRAVGGLSVLAVAAGFAVTIGVGTASAAPGSLSWADGNTNLSRTISNVTPVEGEIITSSTTFKRAQFKEAELLWMVKDFHQTCLTYVPNSAKLNGNAIASTSEAGFAMVGSPTATTTLARVVDNLFNGGTTPATFVFSYKVGADCARGVPLVTGMDYNGDLGFSTFATKGPSVSVSKNVSTTALAPVTGAKVGQSTTVSATVTGGADSNIVEFYDGITKLGEGALSAGTATLAWTPATDGQHSLTAKFLGTTAAIESTSAPQNVQVIPADVETTTTLTVPATVDVGADVTFTAAITPATATGQVQFKDGDVNVGNPVTVVNGQASITRQFPEAGTHSITAHFVSSGGSLNSDSAVCSLTVNDADFGTTTTVLEPLTATVGVETNLSATVMPFPSAGEVEFTVDGVLAGSAEVGTGDGVAVLPHTFDTVGTSTVVAKFLGTPGFTGSTSVEYSVTVKDVEPNRVDTTTALGVTGNSNVGTPMTFTATVAPSTANGTIQFKVGNTLIGAPVAVVNGVATGTHTFDSEGTYTVTAVFVGGDGWNDSVSGPTVVGITTATTTGPGTGSLGSLSGIFGS